MSHAGVPSPQGWDFGLLFFLYSTNPPSLSLFLLRKKKLMSLGSSKKLEQGRTSEIRLNTSHSSGERAQTSESKSLGREKEKTVLDQAEDVLPHLLC